MIIPLSVKVWGLRVLVIGGLLFLGFVSGSSAPALAIWLTWLPNLVFLVAFTRGIFPLPQCLVKVRPIEPVFYGWIGVALIKAIVATRMWPMLLGADPPEKLKASIDALDRAEQTMMGSEVCHGATFILVFLVVLYYLAAGRTEEVLWITFFNIILNGYPVMLQRANRWRIQQVRKRHLGRTTTYLASS